MKFICRLAFFLAAATFSPTAHSQTTPAHTFGLSLAIDAALPTGVQKNGTKGILGGDIRLRYGLTDKFALTFTTGGYHFFPKQNLEPVRRESFGLGPIKVGIKVFFMPSVYFGAEAGVAYLYSEHGYSKDPPLLILSPAVGYANSRWDFGFRYENFSGVGATYGMMALRVAYGFRL